MPRPLPPLPTALRGHPFTLAQARAAQVSRHRLDASDLHTPTWGVRSDHAPTTLDQYATQVALGLPAEFAYSHRTAARLWRLPLPTRWVLDEPLDVMTRGTPLRRRGVVGHRGLATRPREVLRGLPVTRPVPTWVDLASVPGIDSTDLVVAADAFATRDPGLLPQLVRAAAEATGRGSRALHAAGPLLRAGSGSPMETRARLAFGRARLPEPELNATVHGEDGQFVARVDFLWRRARVVVEYEGDQHRSDRRRWQYDIARTRLLEALGWRVVRITSADLDGGSRQEGLVAHLRELVG